MQASKVSSPRTVPARILRLALVLLSTFALAGCAESPSMLAPASPNATIVYNLTVLVFGIAVIVFVVVEAILLISVIRFSRRTGPDEPEQIEGNTKFEIAWTAAPAIVLLVVFFVSLQALFPLADRPAVARNTGNVASAPSLVAGDPLRVRAVGHQWWWEFQYPDHKVVTANELHVPLGTLVSVDVESVDVIHSFWIPQMGGKIDVIPGRVNHTWFQPEQVGTFQGQCAEFCGVQHANMRFAVVVEPKEEFQAWLENQQGPAVAATDATAKGEQVFMTGACIGCHTVDGTKAQGKIGPNLSHFASRSVFAGATAETNAENLRRWLADPQKMKPGNLMKIAPLSSEQIDALVDYLLSLE